MRKNAMFRGCTRPPMFLGVPYVPFFLGAGGCMLLAMYFNLFFLGPNERVPLQGSRGVGKSELVLKCRVQQRIWDKVWGQAGD